MGRRNQRQAPTWFKLENYDGIEGLSTSEITSLLFERSLFFERSCSELVARTQVPTNILENQKNIYQKIQTKPLEPTYPIQEEQKYKHNLDPSDNSQAIELGVVGQLSLANVFDMATVIPEEAERALQRGIDLSDLGENYDKWGKLPASFDINRFMTYEDIRNHRTNTLIVGINLETTNEIILETFSELLTKIRKKNAYQSTKYSRADITKLVRSKVLPYLDLKIWAQVESRKFSNYDAGRWLDESADNIRKTTVGHAIESISMPFRHGVYWALRD